MPFDANNRFMPQQSMALSQQAPSAQVQQSAQLGTQPQAAQAVNPAMRMQSSAMQQSQPVQQTSMAMRAVQPTYQMNRMVQNYMPPQNQMARSQFQPQQQPPPQAAPGAPAVAAPPPPPQAPQGPQGVQSYGMSQLGAPGQVAATQQQAPGQSVTQQAGRGNAQSVQNYMTALNQTGQSSNNANMNQPGQLGAGPQSGFVGFGQNGSQGYGPSMVQQGYTGQMSAGPSQVYNPGVGYQNNGAGSQRNGSVGNSASQGSYGGGGTYNGQQSGDSPWADNGNNIYGMQTGGTGGVGGQPQWQTPKPWGQPGNNAPGTAGSYLPNDSKGWETYFGAGGGHAAPITPGAFYSGDPTEPDSGVPIGAPTSDERAKTNISDAKGELQDFLDNLGAYSYEYKDKKHGEGRYISPMAQEFEKSQLGAQAVETGPDGIKRVHYGRLIGVQSAALALINHKLNALEKKFSDGIKTNLKGKNGK